MWKVAITIIKIFEAFLKVKGHRIINGRADLGLSQTLLKSIAPRGSDDELVVNVGAGDVGGFVRR